MHLAREMDRRGLELPLLIGGATTGAKHTAVKIAPAYPPRHRTRGRRLPRGGRDHVARLAEQRDGYVAEIAADYAKIRAQHAQKKGPGIIPLAAARANAFRPDWSTYVPPQPLFTGRREFRNVDLRGIAALIDWGPFFQAWELAGPYPAILDDPVVGAAARNVLAEGQAMLAKIIDGRWLTASGVAGFWPANARGDDIVLWRDASRKEPALVWHGLRQQNPRPEGKPNYALADFVAPEDGQPDFLGAFAVTAGLGIERSFLAEFAAKQDDYSGLLLKSSPTALPRRSPSGCAGACAPSSGATRATSRSTCARWCARIPRHPSRRTGYRRARTTR